MNNIFFEANNNLKLSAILPDYFSLFELEKTYQIDLIALEESFENYIFQLHPDFFANATEQQKKLSLKYSAIIKQAKDTLTNPYTRAIYLCNLFYQVPSEKELKQSQDFLIEILEVREKIENSETLETQKELIVDLKKEYQKLQKELQTDFKYFINNDNNKKDLFFALAQKIGKIKYYKNIEDQLEIL